MKTPYDTAHRRYGALAAILALGALAAPLPGQETHHAHASRVAPHTTGVRILPGLGSHGRKITTSSALAQRFFDQGLNLAYAFNHAEALRSFREAARLDPSCAMCHWGIAYVLGPNINAAMDPASNVEAHAAAKRAQQLAGAARVSERGLIDAISVRYLASAPQNRATLDTLYADAMQQLFDRHPNDADIATLYAESMMQLSPWVYWTSTRTPRAGTSAILVALERVLTRDREHPGACHFYIHAVEAAFPARALPCAERLAELMPGAGHIVHMPGHIYLRVGRYNDAIEANRHAVHADEAYLADAHEGGPPGFYEIAYYPHNFHFLGFAATMAGRSSTAITAARDAARRIPVDVAAQSPELQLLIAYPHLALAMFGRWSEVHREKMPPSRLRVATALTWFARGMADVASKRIASAQAALDTVRAVAAVESRYPVSPVLQIATRVLESELLTAAGDRRAAIEALTQAMHIEDELTYMEPPYWHQPVRQLLGAALLADDKAADAARRYREDLDRFPDNVWSLRGLSRALEAQGKRSEAKEMYARYRRAAERSDISLTGSRF
jgi:tetratricopeptide (TPR) repeat protein